MKDLGRLTLEEKVGQLFFVGFQGRTPDLETRVIWEIVRPGGFLLFQRNIETFDQVYNLTSQLRDVSSVLSFVAIDHEGGRVDRLKQLFAPMPSMRELAEAGTAQLRIGGKIIAGELEATGFNTDFAPVLDIDLPGSVVRERTFSRDPEEVARLGAAFLEELSKRNVIGCCKHFPGLGGAVADPHFVLSRIERTRKELQQVDLLPFSKLAHQAGMVMVSHAHYPALGDDRPTPASLSSRIVEGLLRKKLGFQGVVITDDFTMGAVTAVGLTPDLFLEAFEAGNDMILFSQTTPLLERAFKTILKTARASAPLRRRVDESVERILKLKSRIDVPALRYRAQVKSRLMRQIEKIRNQVTPAAASDHPLSRRSAANPKR